MIPIARATSGSIQSGASPWGRASRFGFCFAIALLQFLFVENARATPEPIRIGCAFALSGVAASFGEGERNGALLAVDEINQRGGIGGRPLELLVEDSKSSSLGSVNAVTKLLLIDKVRYLLGPTWADSYPGAIPIAAREGALVLLPSAAIRAVKRTPADFPLTFSLWYNIEREIETLLADLKTRNVATIAAWSDQDPFFELLVRLLEERAPHYGVKIVERSEFLSSTSDFRTKLVQLRSRAPEGLVFGFTDEGTLLSFLRQRALYYPDLPLLGLDYIDGFVGNPTYATLLRGMRYVSPAPVGPDFVDRYKARFGRDPILSAPTSYDAVRILANALSSGAREPAEVASHLRAHTHSTVTFGDVRFDPLGGVTDSEYRVTQVP